MKSIAIIKFNGGKLALLCSKCSVIIKIGRNFTEKEIKFSRGEILIPALYCDNCKKNLVMNLKEVFSKQNIEKRLKEIIINEYGVDHDIKIAILKTNGKYNDETYDYKPILILIDKDYNELYHEIDLSELLPSRKDQEDYEIEYEDILTIKDLTIKF